MFVDLQSFHQWAYSDVLTNTQRGILAEYIVAKALGIDSTKRVEWEAFDLITKEGLKIEVKSSAYLQSWKQNGLSKISFGIQATKAWNPSTNEYSKEQKRQADVYVFCLLQHIELDTVNPLDVTQWTFYVLPTKVLNEKVPNQKSIGLSGLKLLGSAELIYEDLSTHLKRLPV